MCTLPLDALAAGLRAHARGDYGTEAAVDLLIGHRRWLERPDFLDALVLTDRERHRTPLAWICWPQVPAFLADAPCSSSEARILRLAASLAGTDPARPLSDLLTGLDDSNTALVAGAIAHALTHGHQTDQGRRLAGVTR